MNDSSEFNKIISFDLLPRYTEKSLNSLKDIIFEWRTQYLGIETSEKDMKEIMESLERSVNEVNR